MRNPPKKNVDGDFAQLKKRSAFDRLGDLVPHGLSSDFLGFFHDIGSRKLSRNTLSQKKV